MDIVPEGSSVGLRAVGTLGCLHPPSQAVSWNTFTLLNTALRCPHDLDSPLVRLTQPMKRARNIRAQREAGQVWIGGGEWAGQAAWHRAGDMM